MSQKEDNINRLKFIYNEIYNIKDGSCENILKADFIEGMAMKSGIVEKQLAVLEPYYNYKIKEMTLGTGPIIRVYISMNTNGIPYIGIGSVFNDFKIPKDWKNVTVIRGFTCNQQTNAKLYISYARNIYIDKVNYSEYDNTYALISNIGLGNIIVSHIVYKKILEKVYYDLINSKKAYSIFKDTNEGTVNYLDKFIQRYVYEYIPKDKLMTRYGKIFRNYDKLLTASNATYYREEYLKNLLHFIKTMN